MAHEGTITLGLSEVHVGEAQTSGIMPDEMAKIGKIYKDTCKISQDDPDVTEHYEEGKAAPEVRKKTVKIPSLSFSLMDANVQDLIDYIGGSNIGTDAAPKWGYSGGNISIRKSIRIKTEQGLWFDIPNGDIIAKTSGDLTSSGIFLVDFTVTPLAVDLEDGALQAYIGSDAA